MMSPAKNLRRDADLQETRRGICLGEAAGGEGLLLLYMHTPLVCDTNSSEEKSCHSVGESTVLPLSSFLVNVPFQTQKPSSHPSSLPDKPSQ